MRERGKHGFGLSISLTSVYVALQHFRIIIVKILSHGHLVVNVVVIAVVTT